MTFNGAVPKFGQNVTLGHNIRFGDNVVVWQNATICDDCIIGEGVVIGSNVWIGKKVTIGAGSRIQHGAFIPNGTNIGTSVFIGPNVTLTDDRYPTCNKTSPYTAEPPIVEDLCAIGAGAVILPGVRIHRGSLVGAGAVVTHDVPRFVTVVGAPAAIMGYGRKITEKQDQATSIACGIMDPNHASQTETV